MELLSNAITDFYSSLRPPGNLPASVEILYPQSDEQVMEVVRRFYSKYYADNNPRQLLFGINPGRFGAGTTGINFTAPKQLAEYCGIPNPFKQRSELSAEFIYDMITAYGGCDKFYSTFFITSVSPLGFVKEGVNLNYYDDKILAARLRPWIIDTIRQQIEFTRCSRACICIGGEKNFKYLSDINDEQDFFDQIIPLPHPRFIMQYRRKQKDEYISAYMIALHALESARH